MTTTLLDEIPTEEPAATATRAPGHLLGVNAAELCVLGIALALPVAFALQDFTAFFMPKAALLLLLVGPGLCVLGVACLRRDVAAWWAACFLAVAAVSTALSDVPVMSVFGSYAWGNGLILVAALMAFWALGRTLGPRARELLVLVLLAGALINGVWAWLQMSVDLGQPAFRPFLGRAMGLMGNPVQLGALCAAAMWLAAGKTKDRLVPALVTLAVLAGAVQLSGSRVALAAGVAAVLLAAVRAGLKRGVLLGAAVLIGLSLSLLVPGTGGSSTQRVTGATSSGLGPRVALWRSAGDGIVEQPLIGYGPGRFYVGATPHSNLETARYTGGDTLYADAHNFVVEYATTTGLLGLVALCGFLVVAGRRARGPLVGFVIVAAITMLLQPQYVGLTPLVLLALGAAGPSPRLFATKTDDTAARPSATKVAFVVLCGVTALVGAVAAYRGVSGDASFKEGITNRKLAPLDRADGLFPPWPDVPAQRGSLYATQRFITGDTKYEELAEINARHAMQRDPSDPQWTFQVGNLEEASHRYANAARLYDKALRLNPWSVNALSGAYRVAVRTDRYAEAVRLRSRLCQIGRESCPPPPAKYRAQLGK